MPKAPPKPPKPAQPRKNPPAASLGLSTEAKRGPDAAGPAAASPRPLIKPAVPLTGSPRMTTAAPTLAPEAHPHTNGHTPPRAAAPAQQAPAATPTVSAVFGEIAWLMTQSTVHKSMFLSDLEWPRRAGAESNQVMPPLMLGQFRLFHGPDPLKAGNQRPIGCIFWALAVPEVAERLATGITRMRPTDWRPAGLAGVGDTAAHNTEAVVWIVDCLAPFGGTDQMIQDFKDKVFPGRDVKWRSVGGATEVERMT
jgi:cytolysin-activating lysine-acyltransferase